MIRSYDFRCQKCGHVEERFVDTREWRLGDAVPCAKCHGPAIHDIPAPRASLDGCSGHFPSAADAWERRRESHMRKEQHNAQEHGTYK